MTPEEKAAWVARVRSAADPMAGMSPLKRLQTFQSKPPIQQNAQAFNTWARSAGMAGIGDPTIGRQIINRGFRSKQQAMPGPDDYPYKTEGSKAAVTIMQRAAANGDRNADMALMTLGLNKYGEKIDPENKKEAPQPKPPISYPGQPSSTSGGNSTSSALAEGNTRPREGKIVPTTWNSRFEMEKLPNGTPPMPRALSSRDTQRYFAQVRYLQNKLTPEERAAQIAERKKNSLEQKYRDSAANAVAGRAPRPPISYPG